MGKVYTQRQVCLMNQFRVLWTQHVYWTRFFIVSTAADLDDSKEVTKRLLRNPDDFAKLLLLFYGTQTAECFKRLFTEHLLIAGELVSAAKKGDTSSANSAREEWYKNADDIARFLGSVNPCWNVSKWRNMLYRHLEMTEKEAVLYLKGDYTASIQMFERIEEEALKMADYMSCGIIEQCFHRCQ